MNTTQSIFKSTSIFTTGLVIQKIMAFVYFTILASIFGPEKLGVYVFVFSYIGLFGLVIDFGTNHYITREIARNTKQAPGLIARIFGFKCFASFVAVALAAILALVLGYDQDVWIVLGVGFGIMIFESLSITMYAVMRGFGTLTYETYSTVGAHALILLFGLLAARMTNSVVIVTTVVLGVYIANAVYAWYILQKVFSIPIRFIFSWQEWKKILVIVVPFALAAGFAKIYGAFDQIMLSKMATSAELGYYAVAYKLTFALQFIPMALVASLYPVFSATHTKNPKQTNRLFEGGIGVLLAVAIPISIVTWFAAFEGVLFLYGDSFISAVAPLQLLILSLPFLFINFPIGSLLNATDHQKQQTKNMGLALVLNIILNVFFIPNYYAAGAALASTISTVCLSLLGLVSVRKYTQFSFDRLLGMVRGIIVSATVLIGSIWIMNTFTNAHWLLICMVGGFVYVITIMRTKFFSLSAIRNFLHKKM